MSPTICGCITVAETGRQRCVKPIDHRGPHWDQTQPIDCDCLYFCFNNDHIREVA